MSTKQSAPKPVLSISPDEIVKFIDEYRSDIKDRAKETSRKELFVVLLTQLFPDRSKDIRGFTSGAERFIKVEREVPRKGDKGFIDTFFGNLVIEFEHGLPEMLSTAEDQLRGYVATLWDKPQNYTPYLCIATDGMKWHTYTPILKDPESLPLQKDDVEIVPNEQFDLENLADPVDFYFWIDRIMFRDNSLTPTSKQICVDFGVNSHSFKTSADILSKLLENALKREDVKTAFGAWAEYLKYTYGDIKANHSLFLRHTYLSGFTKLLMAQVISSKKRVEVSVRDIPDIIEGTFFYKLQMTNYVEKDFFYWMSYPPLRQLVDQVWIAVFHSLKTYDFRHVQMDFLKGIYQDLIDPEDRHDLGEYYTPDWLCEKLADEYLSRTASGIPRMADVTCGSGSFLRVAIKKCKTLLKQGGDSALEEILSNIVGFEIHPLAVFISKTNYLLALDELIEGDTPPLAIPVYLCDSLLMPFSTTDQDGTKETLDVRLGSDSFKFPLKVVSNSEAFGTIVDFADSVSHSLATGSISEGMIGSHTSKFLGGVFKKSATKEELLITTESLIALIEWLSNKISNKKNTIWAYILKNNYKPAFLSNSFDLILGNPPWLSFRYIEDDSYKKEVEQLGINTYGIAPKNSSLRTHMELATIFLVHATHQFLKPKGKLAFVMPRSIFSADHHESLRKCEYSAEMSIDEIWDLEDTKPIFNVPTCVVITSKNKPSTKPSYFNGRTLSGTLPSQDTTLDSAKPLITETKRLKLWVCSMGKRTALSTTKFHLENEESPYKSKFKQGADLMPRGFYFLKVNSKGKGPLHAQTHPAILKESKKPYRDVNMQGLVESDLLFKTCIAANVLPFVCVDPYTIHLPVVETDGDWMTVTPGELALQGRLESSKWFETAEGIYENKKTQRAKSLFEMLNYNNKLLCQNPRQKFWVLFCASGTNACAAVFENDGLFWADQKTYWLASDSEEECYYLAGILNSASVNKIIKPFQSKGLLGERDIHKKILDVGIPEYKVSDKQMKALAKKAKSLAKDITKFVPQLKKASLAKKRDQVRKKFANRFSEINDLTADVLGIEEE